MFIKSILSAVSACLMVVSFNLYAATIQVDNGSEILLGEGEYSLNDDGLTGFTFSGTTQFNSPDSFFFTVPKGYEINRLTWDNYESVNRELLTFSLYEWPKEGGATLVYRYLYCEYDGQCLSESNYAPPLSSGRYRAYFGAPQEHFGNYPLMNDYYSLNVIVESVVPIPSAVWLFGSGLLGLIGVARRKKL